jgi:hypothetical protein
MKDEKERNDRISSFILHPFSPWVLSDLKETLREFMTGCTKPANPAHSVNYFDKNSLLCHN